MVLPLEDGVFRCVYKNENRSMKSMRSKILSGLCIVALLTAAAVNAAEEMAGDELKSQQKSSLVFKSRNGVKAPGLPAQRSDLDTVIALELDRPASSLPPVVAKLRSK